MAKSDTITAKNRRQMLKENAASLSGAGRAFLDAGRTGEALECFAAAKDTQGLADVGTYGLENGDLFVWRQAKRLLGEDLDPEQLSEIGQRAQAAGKTAFAQTAEGLRGEAQGDS